MGVTATFDGLTIQKGYSTAGGAVFCAVNSTLWITDSTLSDNTAADGGAVAFRGKLTITNSLLVGNQASGAFGKGGAVSSSQGALTITSSTIAGNSAGDDGGGLWLYTNLSTTTLRNSIVAGNTADGYGPDINTRVSADSVFNLVGNGNYMRLPSNGTSATHRRPTVRWWLTTERST